MIEDIEDFVDENVRLIDQKLAYYNILNEEVSLQLDENVVIGRVQLRFCGPRRITICWSFSR